MSARSTNSIATTPQHEIRTLPLPSSSKMIALQIASYLTDPICKMRECYYRFYTINQTCSTITQKVTHVACLILGMIVCFPLAFIGTPLGAAIRGGIATTQEKPYIYLARSHVGKVLPEDRQITVVSHNQCYMPAGYSITDGQVTPPSDKRRMDANIQRIKDFNPDIVCLYEVADICDAKYISSQLGDYPFIIPCAGIRAFGPSSMMYVASKYEIVASSITFTPFIKNTELTGRARFSEKGILSFDIKSHGTDRPFASIISTHLQHSEIPARPEPIEQSSRALQMDRVLNVIQNKADLNIIFTGDLNQENRELLTYLATKNDLLPAHTLRFDPNSFEEPTWGGDRWCARLMNKPSSGPQVLDYTFIAGQALNITTQVQGTGFHENAFRPEAGSDHNLLFSTITVR